MLVGGPQDEEADMEEVLTTRKRKRKMEDLSETDDDRVEKLLEELLQSPGFDKDDILYSRRYRKQVREILDRIQVSMKINVRKYTGDTTSDEDSDEDDDDDITVLRKRFYHLAECIHGLEVYESVLGTFWHRQCFPRDPDRYSPPLCGKLDPRIDRLKTLERLLSPVVLKSRRLEETFDVDYVRSRHVASLLGNVLVDQNGNQRSVPEACSGKYVFVCCVHAPVVFGFESFQSLITLCNELSSERGDVQVVMVAKMSILADTCKAFDQLFSAFPKSCLAVPYHEEGLEDVARLLSRGTYLLPRCVVYGLDGMFLESFYSTHYKRFPYGAEAFPFTNERVQKVLKKRAQLQTDRLENLLRPYEWSRPDDVVVYDSENRRRPISEVVKNKHVGLYLCSEDNLYPRLVNLSEHCRINKLEFEIVVLYLPFASGADPHKFAEMRANGLVRGWWILPFNNSVSLRFSHLTDVFPSHCEHWGDKLIIVGPDGKILDMYGAQAIKIDYTFGAHPFTRAAVVENRMRQVRDVKLESLVAGGSFFRGDDPNHVISARTLLESKKKIIIYLGRLNDRKVNDLVALISQYKEMKRNGDEFEVVIVDFSGPRRAGTYANKYGRIPWYICCCRPDTYLVEMLRKLVKVGSLVGFGEDGLICSVKPLHTSDTAGLCLENTLFADLYHYFQFDQCEAI